MPTDEELRIAELEAALKAVEAEIDNDENWGWDGDWCGDSASRRIIKKALKTWTDEDEKRFQEDEDEFAD